MIFRSLLFATVLLALALSASALGAAQQSKKVATVSKGNYRVVLLASKTSAGAAPTARVSVQAYVRKGQTWASTRTTRLPRTYFWKTITARGAICHLHLATGAKPTLTVSLLITPSIGCDRPASVPLTG